MVVNSDKITAGALLAVISCRFPTCHSERSGDIFCKKEIYMQID